MNEGKEWTGRNPEQEVRMKACDEDAPTAQQPHIYLSSYATHPFPCYPGARPTKAAPILHQRLVEVRRHPKHHGSLGYIPISVLACISMVGSDIEGVPGRSVCLDKRNTGPFFCMGALNKTISPHRSYENSHLGFKVRGLWRILPVVAS